MKSGVQTLARTARERSQSTTEARLANGGLKDAAGGPPVPVEMLLSDDGAAGTGRPDIYCGLDTPGFRNWEGGWDQQPHTFLAPQLF